MNTIHILHENRPWIEPLKAAFDARGANYRDWFVNEGTVALDELPPEGVFYNRMSASSHTRGHRYAPELTHAILSWLEREGRTVVNGTQALYLEVSKVAQYAALAKAGIKVPRTHAAAGRDAVLKTAKQFDAPFILKPNRGGKGLGVRRFDDTDALAGFLDTVPDEEQPIDGLWLVQDYVQSVRPRIIRAEFIGGRFHYAVAVDTSRGFELCPADVCNVIPADGEAPDEAQEPNIFTILPDFDHPILWDYARFLSDNGIGVAGIEFIEAPDGLIYTYDVNTNTNYNQRAEAEAGLSTGGMEALADYLIHLAEREETGATGHRAYTSAGV